MFNNLTLTRPLAVLDLETTGTDPKTSRIVEISVLRYAPGAEPVHRTRRVNPGVPIPAEASDIHGIFDADVADELAFEKLAPGLLLFLEGCDLCGFNLKRFDLRVLHAEFQRAGSDFPLDGRAVLDPMEMFHAKEKRDLAAAVRFYLDRDHDGAHAARADVLATAAVLDAMLVRYADLPRDVLSLHSYFKNPAAVDSDSFFTRVEGEVRFKKGKHRGEPLFAVARQDRDYLRWMLDADFAGDTKAVVRGVMG